MESDSINRFPGGSETPLKRSASVNALQLVASSALELSAGLADRGGLSNSISTEAEKD